MALVQIQEVSLARPAAEEPLLSCAITAPGRAAASEAYALKFEGWALGRGAAAARVEFLHQGQVVRETPVCIPSPDILKRHPRAAGAERCRFSTMVGLLTLPLEFEIELRAVLDDGNVAQVGSVRGRRLPLRSSFEPRLQPLIVTCLARTGTTWLMRLLAEHPAVVAYRGYPLEVRELGYSLRMLRVLSEPADFQPRAATDFADRNALRVGPNPGYYGRLAYHPLIGHWFGRTYVERLAAFCQQNVEDFYQVVAVVQGQAEARYFAEKLSAWSQSARLAYELYPGAREIVLVRDFRDMVSSILAFNAKRGYAAFGRESVETDAAFVEHVRNDVASLLHGWKERAGSAHLVRYEDLITRPVESLRRTLEYLDIAASPEIIHGMIERAGQESDAFIQHKTIQDSKQSIGRWRNDLAPDLLALCQQSFGEALAEFGYASNA
jgi:hypothetical protein